MQENSAYSSVHAAHLFHAVNSCIAKAYYNMIKEVNTKLILKTLPCSIQALVRTLNIRQSNTLLFHTNTKGKRSET